MTEYLFRDVLTIINGRNQKKIENPNGKYPIYGSGGIMGYADDFLCDAGTVVIGRKGTINRPIYVDEPFWNVDTAFGLCANQELLFPKYLYYFCENFNFEKLSTTVTIPSLTKANLLNIKISLPPLAEQKRIAAILDKVNGIIRKRKQSIKLLDELVKAKFVEMFGDPLSSNSKKWPLYKIGDKLSVTSGGTPYTDNPLFWENGDIPWIGSNMCQNNMIYKNDGKFITQEGLEKSSTKIIKKGNVLVALVGATIGKVGLLKFDTAINQNIAAINVNASNEFSSEYIYYLIQFLYNKFMEIGSDKFKMANQSFIKNLILPTPPLFFQKKFSDYVIKNEVVKLNIKKYLEDINVLKFALVQTLFKK